MQGRNNLSGVQVKFAILIRSAAEMKDGGLNVKDTP